MPTGFTLCGVEVHYYGLLIVTGILAALILAAVREKRYGLPKDTSLDLVLFCVPVALLGARIYYVLFSWETYRTQALWHLFAVWEGGLAVYGGIIAGVLMGALYAKHKGLRFATLADLAAPCIALGQSVGRWGNFVNGEAHGDIVTREALRFFPVAVSIGGEWYYATFFYESLWCLLIVAILLIREKRVKNSKPGDGFLLYVLLYAVERFFVEGLRTDSLYWGSIRVSQLLSGAAILAVAIIWYGKHRKKTQP